MQVALMAATTGIHLLLCQGTEPIGMIDMALHLNLQRFLTQNIVSVMVSPGHEFRGGTLTSLEHIARVTKGNCNGSGLLFHGGLLRLSESIL